MATSVQFFDNTAKPGVYFRYVDDTFVIFGSELDCDHFQEKTELATFSSKIYSRGGAKQILEFLDVLVEKEGTGFLTNIYRKPTFTGQYIRWNSFSQGQEKLALSKL